MAAHLVRLKLTLLQRQVSASMGQALGLLGAAVAALIGLLLAVAGLTFLQTLPADDAGTWLTAIGAGLIVAWALSPLGAFGSDQTLDPARFVTFAVPRRQLVTGLLAGSVIGVPAIATVLAALATTIAWARGPAVVLVAVLGGLIGAVTCLVVARATGTALAALQSRRRFREVAVTLGVLLISGVSFVPLMITEGVLRIDAQLLRPVIDVVALTPLGWAWSAPWDAATGALGLAVVKLVLAAALVPALMYGWGAMLARQLALPAASGPATAGGRPGVLTRLRGPIGAVAGRCLTYWRRDPRYTLSLVTLLAFPLLMFLLVVAGMMALETWALLLAPLLAFFIGWGLHNDVAYDADPWWLHLAAHVPGRADRAGRVLASAIWGTPLLVIAVVAGALLVDRTDMLPALFGMSALVLGAGYGVSSVSAVIAPYWAPAPGENPSARPPGVGMQMFVSQMATGAAMLAISAPLLAPYFLAWQGSGTAAWVTLGLGLTVGAGLALGGILLGGRLMDRRGPELLATVRR